MRCKHCHGDGSEPYAPEAFKDALEELDGVGNRIDGGYLSEDGLARLLYTEADANYPAEDDDGDLTRYEALAYYFPGDDDPVVVDSPLEYFVSESGDHVILADGGETEVVIPRGWRKLEKFLHFGLKNDDEFGE